MQTIVVHGANLMANVDRLAMVGGLSNCYSAGLHS